MGCNTSKNRYREVPQHDVDEGRPPPYEAVPKVVSETLPPYVVGDAVKVEMGMYDRQVSVRGRRIPAGQMQEWYNVRKGIESRYNSYAVQFMQMIRTFIRPKVFDVLISADAEFFGGIIREYMYYQLHYNGADSERFSFICGQLKEYLKSGDIDVRVDIKKMKSVIDTIGQIGIKIHRPKASKRYTNVHYDMVDGNTQIDIVFAHKRRFRRDKFQTKYSTIRIDSNINGLSIGDELTLLSTTGVLLNDLLMIYFRRFDLVSYNVPMHRIIKLLSKGMQFDFNNFVLPETVHYDYTDKKYRVFPRYDEILRNRHIVYTAMVEQLNVKPQLPYEKIREAYVGHEKKFFELFG